MTEEEWQTCADPLAVLYALYRGWPHPHHGRHRKLRLLACALCRLRDDLTAHPDWADAITAAERSADGRGGRREVEALCQQVGVRVGVYPFAGMGTAIEAASGSMHIVTDYRPRRPAEDRGDPQNRLVRLVKRLLGRDDAYMPTAKFYRLPEVRALLPEVFGNPFHPAAIDPVWKTSTAVSLARQMYESRDFSPMPILADALQDAGCGSPSILDHCRSGGPHVRGCWVVDLVLGKE